MSPAFLRPRSSQSPSEEDPEDPQRKRTTAVTPRGRSRSTQTPLEQETSLPSSKAEMEDVNAKGKEGMENGAPYSADYRAVESQSCSKG
ncbi:hypothetical protein STEG23_008467, partial [Scotinomys teguina]